MPIGRLYSDLGIQKSGGTYHLLYHLGGFSKFQIPRRGADKDSLVDMGIEFVKIQRAVVKR